MCGTAEELMGYGGVDVRDKTFPSQMDERNVATERRSLSSYYRTASKGFLDKYNIRMITIYVFFKSRQFQAV